MLFSGLLGVCVCMLLCVPFNGLLHALLENASNVQVQLPWMAGGILVALSVVITMIGGLLPAKKAAHKDPVNALRSE